jgi:hypothetical protein
MSEPGCIFSIGAGPSLGWENLDLTARKDGRRVKKGRGYGEINSHTPSVSEDFGVTPDNFN